MDTPPPITSSAPPAPSAQTDASTEKLLVILCHLSAFLGVGLILPLIIWLVKRSETGTVAKNTAAHACEALNFHLTFFILAACCAPFAFVMMIIPFVNVLFFFVLLPVMALVALGTFILAILAALKASEGGFYRYPFTLRLVK